MAFNELYFIFTWLPILLAVYYFSPKRIKNTILLIISLLFYAWGNPIYSLLLLFSILLNYVMGLGMERFHQIPRKHILIFILLVNICMLAYFKYYGFFLESLCSLLSLHVEYNLPSMPLGISFFTFSLISYQIDVYRKKCKPQRNLINFAVYVSFFPKIMMGPLISYTSMEKQFHKHHITMASIDIGARRFICGLAQKVILADTFAQVWQIYQNDHASMFAAWLGIIAFTLQIYFDFNGYTHMAIGLANMLGFQLPENFNKPYHARSISDFWRRWHMTLSYWFRDYVYIPLGGNRVSHKKHMRNLLIVWLLTGLWHGASWNFILWGLYYGILLICEKYLFQTYRKRLSPFLNWLITILLVMIGWVFFASNTIEDAFQYIGHMFNFTQLINTSSWWYFRNYLLYYAIGILACTPLFHRIYSYICKKVPQHIHIIAAFAYFLLFAISICYLVNNTYTSFLYFNF